ncbi:hypothetical protein [Aliikangiella sp. IMCC44632]
MQLKISMQQFQPLVKRLTQVMSGFALLTATNLVQADTIEFQQAAQFTHLKWPNQLNSPVTVTLSPLLNHSGIPIEKRDERAEYYYYGKLPAEVQHIYQDVFNASHYFKRVKGDADYHIQVSIDEYILPFNYAPDDEWWNKLHDQADRWLQAPATSQVTLTLKLSSGKKPIKPWMQSVTMALSPCDLNRYPQPASSAYNQDKTRQKYLSTTPGQTFLAAANYLVLKAKQRIEQEPILATVVQKYQQEIHLSSENLAFKVGQKLPVFIQQEDQKRAQFSLGELQVFKTQGDYAIAYPINLRADHLKSGDWVQLGYGKPAPMPATNFVSLKRCAQVSNAVASVN